LPLFVKTLARNGITVTVLGADIVDDQTPHIEEMLGTASSLGIRFRWRGFRFDYDKPYAPQLDRDTPTLPRETVIGLLKHDYETIHAAVTAAGVA
jgi:hypothetical protein